MEAVTVFISLGSKITADHNCSQSLHEKMLAPRKESNDKPRQHIKKQRCHFAHRGLYRQSYGFSCGGGGSLVANSCLILEPPRTIACQAPLSMGFSRQEYWSGLPFSSPGFCCSHVQM